MTVPLLIFLGLCIFFISCENPGTLSAMTLGGSLTELYSPVLARNAIRLFLFQRLLPDGNEIPVMSTFMALVWMISTATPHIDASEIHQLFDDFNQSSSFDLSPEATHGILVVSQALIIQFCTLFIY